MTDHTPYPSASAHKLLPARKGMRLTPVPWGKPDRQLAGVVCQHLVDANPALVIPFNPIKDKRIRSALHHLRIEA